MSNLDPSLTAGNLSHQQLLETAHTRFGNLIETAGRFSLGREISAGKSIADIIVNSENFESSTRLLVMESDLHDQNLYRRLGAAGVPLLVLNEKLSVPSNDNTELTVFDLPRGLRPLGRDALFNRTSTTTYISDDDIFRHVGEIFGRVWSASGALPLLGDGDSPLMHLGVRSFISPDEEYLFLRPPYVTSELEEFADQQSARAKLIDGMTIALNAVTGDFSLEQNPGAWILVNAVGLGFDQGVVN